jgi:hypothetical protein
MSVAVAAPVGTRRLLSTGVLVGAAAVLLVALVAATGSPRLAADFHASYLDAAWSIRDSGTPWSADAEFPYYYPPLLAELVLPLTLVPGDVASFVAFLGALAALLASLALVGVRDVRCYAALIAWAPGWNELELANASALLALLAAVAWRYRDDARASGSALGASLALKPALWPLLVWDVATRRVRTAGFAVAVGVGLVVVSWSVIGFAGLADYPEQVRSYPVENSYSFLGMAAALGLDPLVGRVVTALAGGALVVAVVHFGRRGDDVRAFTSAVAAALALSPTLWLHYLVLMSVPLAVARPRFSAIWLAPIVLWMCPRDGHGDGIQPFLPAAVALALLVAVLAESRDQRVRPEAVA